MPGSPDSGCLSNKSSTTRFVVTGFVRLLTHPNVLVDPATPEAAVDYVAQWFEFPNVSVLNPGAQHLEIFRNALAAAGVGANLVTDAHLAALAIEHQAEVHSNDADFGRFEGLRWTDPLGSAPRAFGPSS